MTDKKIHELNIDLVNMMMEKFNITYDDIISHLDENKRWLIDGEDWFVHYKFTEDEETEFRNKAIDLIKKRLRCSKRMAEKEFSWWNLQIGLAIDYKDKEESKNDDGKTTR